MTANLSRAVPSRTDGHDPAEEAGGDRPLVSCVTIFLNAGPYIAEAVESILAQEYDRWELLLVDDGSTDESTAIALRFAREHPGKIRYLEHPGHRNRGMSASRNLGIAHARGEYVALLDADDVWLPGKLSAQVAILESRPEAAMTYDATRYWFPGDPDAPAKERLRKLGFPAGTLVDPPALVPLFLNGQAETPGTCSFLIRRRALDRVGGFVDAFSGLFEDQVFFYKVCLEYPVILGEGYSALYRQHAESCCQVALKEGTHREDGTGAALDPFLDWLADHVADRVKAADSPARALDAGLKDYFLRRRGRRRSPIRRAGKLISRALSSIGPRWRRKGPAASDEAP